jgi:hypothetical protein
MTPTDAFTAQIIELVRRMPDEAILALVKNQLAGVKVLSQSLATVAKARPGRPKAQATNATTAPAAANAPAAAAPAPKAAAPKTAAPKAAPKAAAPKAAAPKAAAPKAAAPAPKAAAPKAAAPKAAAPKAAAPAPKAAAPKAAAPAPKAAAPAPKAPAAKGKAAAKATVAKASAKKAAPAKKPAVAKKGGGARQEILTVVERVVKGASGLAASEVAKAAGVPQSRAAAALKELKLAKRIFQGGDRRFARYAGDAKTAEAASLYARKHAAGPQTKKKGKKK